MFLDKDLSFVVGSEAEAQAFVESDPENTTATVSAESGDWTVTRRAGTEIRVPRKMKLTRSVGGQIPTNFDVTKWGIPADMADSVDRVGLWNIVATVDAFLTGGFTPSELLRWVHPSLVANTQGTGMGGMTSMRSLYIDTLLGENRPNDILQEALPNVIAAHVVQSYVGGYGAMVHPVARLRHGSGIRRRRRRQDPTRQGAVGCCRRVRRSEHGRHHRLRRHVGHCQDRGHACQGHRGSPLLAGQRSSPRRIRRVGRRRNDSPRSR